MLRSPPPALALAFCAAIIFAQLLEVAQSQSQNKTQPRTHPAEGVPLSLSLPLAFGFFFFSLIIEESKI